MVDSLPSGFVAMLQDFLAELVLPGIKREVTVWPVGFMPNFEL